MKVINTGHSYWLDSVENKHNQQIDFYQKSNECITHASPDQDGVLTQEVLRALIDRTTYLFNIRTCEETANAIRALKVAFYEFEARAWRRKNQKLNGKDLFHDTEQEVPFSLRDEIWTYPVGKDGHIIVKPPELKNGEWIEQTRMDRATGPAAFMDPAEKISIYSRKEGLIEGIAIHDIDWADVKEYKKFEPLDEAMLDLGVF